MGTRGRYLHCDSNQGVNDIFRGICFHAHFPLLSHGSCVLCAYHIAWVRQSFVRVLSFQQLTEIGVPEFVEVLNAVVQSNKSEIANSSLTISAIVSIVNKISELSTALNQTVMKVGQFLPCVHKNRSAAPLPVAFV